MQAQPEPMVLEAPGRRISDRDLGILIFGLVLGLAAVILGVWFLPPIFVLILVLVLLYPGIGIWKTMRRDWGPAAPRLILGPEALEAGGQLRIRWKDITEVAARTPAGAKPGAPMRVCIRINRLAPVQPVPSTVRRLGLGGYDGYFDVTIPARYGVTAADLAAAIEERRVQAQAPPVQARKRKPREPK